MANEDGGLRSPSKGASVLVTGATGFLGDAVVRRLSRAGYRVTASGRRGRPPELDAQIEYLPLDLLCESDLSLLFPWRWRAVVHLAGTAVKSDTGWDDGAAVIRAHVGTTAALRACLPQDRPVRVVHASGFIVYGLPAALPVTEDHPARPLHAYALAKVLAEDVWLRDRAEGKDRWLLRLPGLFAPARKSGALWHFAAKAAAGGEIVVTGASAPPWDVMHVEDAAHAIAMALASSESDPGPVNISYGEPVSFTSIADRIVELAGSGVVRLTGESPAAYRADITKMQVLLGTFEHSLDDRLGEMVSAARREVEV